MEESLKYLLDAEQRAQEIVNKAIAERDRMLEKASEEVRGAEKRFKGRIPGIRESFLKKAEERADQTNAEILRRPGPWIAVFSVLWLLGWSASARADVAEGAVVEETAAEESAAEEYDDLDFDEDAEEDDSGDPWEPMNRGLFWVNDGLDRYAIDFVFVGHLERETYAESGLAKLDTWSRLEPIFTRGAVTVYGRPGARHAQKSWLDPPLP